ncbi:tetratricopeptide repeat protein [Rhizobiales bacterium Sp-1]|uniref:Tetratricopeptide repeat protein n=2 Tax=Segnochrobactrum spirostomi TaxID=2608987 RepID=A0A6A7Y7C1_9HYPH|nr:tetratricopeptide repeat protein [Segnochrobactrum spirostomi]
MLRRDAEGKLRTFFRNAKEMAPLLAGDELTRHPAQMSENAAMPATKPPATATARAQRLRRSVAAIALGFAVAVTAAPSFAETRNDPGLTSLAGNYLAARLAAEETDIDAAAVFYRAALDDDPMNPILMERAFTLGLASGNLDDAVDLAASLPDSVDVNRLAHLTRAVDAFLKGEPAKARDYLATKSRSPLIELTSSLITSWTFAEQRNEADALKALDRLGNADVFRAFTTYNGGLVADLLGDEVEARQRMKDAYDADPNATRIVIAYARILTRAGDPAAAKAVVDRFAGMVGDQPLVDELRTMLKAGKKAPPVVPNARAGAAAALAAIGATIGREGSTELSAAYLQLALYLDPKAEFAAIALAELYERLDRPAHAIEIYRTIASNSPFYRDAEIQIGLNLNSLDKFEEAKRVLSRVVQQNPGDVEPVLAYGAVLRSHEKFVDAAKVYSNEISRITMPKPRDWILFYNRGICYERTNQWPKAEADFRQALKLSPNQPEVLNYLGYSWADRGVNLDEALAMIRKAAELRPTDGAIIDSLGWALYKLGHYQEAVPQLERAVDLVPGDPVLNDHLGDAYWRVGRTVEARFQWAHARDMKPSPDQLKIIEEKLKNGLPPLAGEPSQSAKTTPISADPKKTPKSDATPGTAPDATVPDAAAPDGANPGGDAPAEQP